MLPSYFVFFSNLILIVSHLDLDSIWKSIKLNTVFFGFPSISVW
ncbi:hypothetical protein GLYMA_01G203650v4 [Glycine max]|nr:hypothetical protein GLYMA_01G203650v4 [Glycine max]KAH1164049.1 hypothetical protein GYH30_002207 [Glycine max]